MEKNKNSVTEEKKKKKTSWSFLTKLQGGENIQLSKTQSKTLDNIMKEVKQEIVENDSKNGKNEMIELTGIKKVTKLNDTISPKDSIIADLKDSEEKEFDLKKKTTKTPTKRTSKKTATSTKGTTKKVAVKVSIKKSKTTAGVEKEEKKLDAKKKVASKKTDKTIKKTTKKAVASKSTKPTKQMKVATVVPVKEEIKIEEQNIIQSLPAKEVVNEKTKKGLKVLYVASECQPFIATGGLGEVAGSLPKAIAHASDFDVRVVLPLYEKIKNDFGDKLQFIANFTTHLAWRQEYCGIFKYEQDGVIYYFIDNERYFKRSKPYGFYDDGERFGFFCKSIVESFPRINFFPDIIHCNDWQSALVAPYIKTGDWKDERYYRIKNIYTIHNVEYQGIYGMENLEDLFGVDAKFKNAVEYNGNINLTKAAIQYADKVSTVSNTYCENLKEAYCSQGLHYIIRRNEYKLCGIVNGIDYDSYNPLTDKIIYKNYDINSLQDKVENKVKFQTELGLPVKPETPMLSIVSRLVSHKGLSLLMNGIESVLQRDVQLVIVGTGDQKYVDYFKYLQSKYPNKVRALVDAYSCELGRKAYAASDIFLMPSKIEPCGISQMIASRYGAVPIVREVGGLKDTIKDFGCEGGGNGYTLASYDANDLMHQINRAIDDYLDKDGWVEKMKTVMSVDFTWNKSALKYIDLYKSLM